MQPNQQMNMTNMGAGQVSGMPAAGVPETAGAGVAPAPVAEAPKKSHNMLIGMIALGVVALCGVVFGVAAMAAKGSEAASYEKQITQLKEMVEEQSGIVTITNPDGATEEVVQVAGNPVISAADSSKTYTIDYVSPRLDKAIEIQVSDGEVSYCRIGVVSFDAATASSSINYSDEAGSYDCEVGGLNGEIYKIVDFGVGQSADGSNIGFIMTDGTVQYIPLSDALGQGLLDVSNVLNIDGFVVDAIDVGVGEAGVMGGYGQTVFVLRDGTIMPYSESML